MNQKKIIDLRGVGCPLNFVRLKLELSKIEEGDCLSVLVDDGEPIDRVPRSLMMEGHEVIEEVMEKDWWQLKVKKGETEIKR